MKRSAIVFALLLSACSAGPDPFLEDPFFDHDPAWAYLGGHCELALDYATQTASCR